jgi:hypothetical protein
MEIANGDTTVSNPMDAKKYCVLLKGNGASRWRTALSLPSALDLVPDSIRAEIKAALIGNRIEHVEGNWGHISEDTEAYRDAFIEALGDCQLLTPPAPLHRPEVIAKAQAKRDRRAAKLTAQFATT